MLCRSMTTEPPSGLSGSLDGACGLANDSSSLVARRSSSGDSDTSALEENASGGDGGPADGWIPAHKGSRVGPIDQERELSGERIRSVDLQPREKLAIPEPPALLELDRQVSCFALFVPQFGERIQEGAAAILLGHRKRPREPFEVLQDLLG